MKKILILLLFPLSLFAQVQYPEGYVSSVNSSTATLTSGSVFTGTSENVSKYAEVRIAIISDVASATDGLSVQQSSNGTNWDITDTYTIPAATGKTFGFGISATFFRIVYTNGGTNQASFRLQTVFHKQRTKPSAVRAQDNRANDNDFEEDLSYTMNYNPTSDTWSRVRGNQTITGQTAQTATVNNIIPSTVSSVGTTTDSYVSGSVQVISTGTGGTFIFETANADGNYQTLPVWNNIILTGTPITAAITPTSSNLIYYFPIQASFIRVRIATTITGGSIQALTRLATSAPYPTILQVAQATAANLNTTATIASGTVTTVSTLSNTTQLTPGFAASNLGKREDDPAASLDVGVALFGIRQDGPTLTNPNAAADYGGVALDDGAAIWTRERGLTYSRVTADGQVKATAGHLQTITISPIGTVTAGVVTIYDSATETGTVIYSCALPITSFTPFSINLNVAALTAIFVGFDATLANVQVTTTFR